LPTSDRHNQLSGNQRQSYLAELLRFLNAGAKALETTGSEVPRGLNPSLRRLCRLYAQALPAIRDEYALLRWHDTGDLAERYGSEQTLQLSSTMGLPLRPDFQNTGSGNDLADLASEAIAALRHPPADAAEATALADRLHTSAMQRQFESRLADRSPIPESEPKPATYRTEVVRQGQRRELQDLIATRYSRDAGGYLIHVLRAWRTPDAKPPVFLDNHDQLSACAWHADTQTEPLYYGKLMIGPFYSPWVPPADDNPAIAQVYAEVRDPALLRMQIMGEDRDGTTDAFELWLADSTTYTAALSAADSLFEVYKV
jgi:hypothetical protein